MECNPLDESKSEYQQWYIKYLTGLRGGIFMIISKKNGKALQMDDKKVKAEGCDDLERQQWRRHGLHILPVEHHVSNVTKILYVKNKSVLVGDSDTSAVNTHFELQHINVADSYI